MLALQRQAPGDLQLERTGFDRLPGNEQLPGQLYGVVA